MTNKRAGNCDNKCNCDSNCNDCDSKCNDKCNCGNECNCCGTVLGLLHFVVLWN
ncbi:hypothetical protein HDF13_000316 [Edaphobacter lichenicola]|uniref:Uncharacterized protein n=1 Tax=Tunturiibacter gelidiferens TaxID=3069689 RepID=A0ACC5NUC8_9BACT|nr:hypothetical protein [Edaphobacter lichenicola]